jgi:hypothetical protein
MCIKCEEEREKMKRIQPNEELLAAIEEMNHDRVNQLPVMANSHMDGMLRREDIIGNLRKMQNFG